MCINVMNIENFLNEFEIPEAEHIFYLSIQFIFRFLYQNLKLLLHNMADIPGNEYIFICLFS